ncbi:MAG: GxxExxY protein [Gemmatimonadota bacterium]
MPPEPPPLDHITGIIIDEALALHRRLGPGMLESVYETLLAQRIERRGLTVRRQYPVSFFFDGIEFEHGFRVDLLVQEAVIVEIKSVEHLLPVHTKQLLTYLRLMDLRLGLLLNFGADLLRNGITRVVNDLPPTNRALLRINKS